MKKQKFFSAYKDTTKVILYLESGHTWEEDDGFVDVFAMERGSYCNGPRCTVCGYDPCWHCEPQPKKMSGKGGKMILLTDSERAETAEAMENTYKKALEKANKRIKELEERLREIDKVILTTQLEKDNPEMLNRMRKNPVLHYYVN